VRGAVHHGNTYPPVRRVGTIHDERCHMPNRFYSMMDPAWFCIKDIEKVSVLTIDSWGSLGWAPQKVRRPSELGREDVPGRDCGILNTFQANDLDRPYRACLLFVRFTQAGGLSFLIVRRWRSRMSEWCCASQSRSARSGKVQTPDLSKRHIPGWSEGQRPGLISAYGTAIGIGHQDEWRAESPVSSAGIRAGTDRSGLQPSD